MVEFLLQFWTNRPAIPTLVFRGFPDLRKQLLRKIRCRLTFDSRWLQSHRRVQTRCWAHEGPFGDRYRWIFRSG